MNKTKVIFRVHQGEVLAMFPAIASTVGNPYRCLSYAHMGQHGACDLGVIRESRPAQPKEYRELVAELRRIGYKLDIRQRTTFADLAERGRQLQTVTCYGSQLRPA